MQEHETIFLSYDALDSDTVGRLRSHLEALGLAAFADRSSLPPGRPWKPILRFIPIDPWGNDYGYVVDQSYSEGFGVYSCGPDGITGR